MAHSGVIFIPFLLQTNRLQIYVKHVRSTFLCGTLHKNVTPRLRILFSRSYLSNDRAYGTVVVCPSVCPSVVICRR